MKVSVGIQVVGEIGVDNFAHAGVEAVKQLNLLLPLAFVPIPHFQRRLRNGEEIGQFRGFGIADEIFNEGGHLFEGADYFGELIIPALLFLHFIL